MHKTPVRKAAAPTIVKMPGEIDGISWLRRRPKSAPASNARIIMPKGTL